MTTVVQTGFSALSGVVTLAVTDEADDVATPGYPTYETVRISNTGAATAYVLFTKAATAATTSTGTPIYAGTTVYFQSTGSSISAIAESSLTTSLDIVGGNGVGHDSSVPDGASSANTIIAALGPATQHQAVTPSDVTTYTGTRALFVGTAGNVVATMDGVDVTYVAQDGQYLLIAAEQVKAATTATNIVRLY